MRKTFLSDFDPYNSVNDKYFDIVLETFHQKINEGSGVSEIIPEQILTQDSNPNMSCSCTHGKRKIYQFLNFCLY